VDGKNKTEDDLAFLRDEREFRNTLLTEQPNGDFAMTMARQLFISAFQYYFFNELKKSKDETFAALAEKSFKEVNYHLRHSSEWVLRLGDGTNESHQRMQDAVNALWIFTGDLFATNETDAILLKAGIGTDMQKVKEQWQKKIAEILSQATIVKPADGFSITGGIEGKHTEHLGHLLSEMQILQRTIPGAEW
jgi:ring-1,2-phenylacetyl-CoA epoxidase subunit PaaC